MPLRMARKRQTMPVAVEPQRWQWKPHGASEICPWTYVQYFMHDSCHRSWNFCSECLPCTHQQLGETRSLCQLGSACAQWALKSHVCSCHHLSAVLEKWRQCIPRSHFNTWRVVDAFIWPSVEMTECWLVWPNVIEEVNCMAQSGCSDSRAHHVLQVKWTCA